MNEKMEEAWMKAIVTLFLSVIILLIVVCVLGVLRIVQELSRPATKADATAIRPIAELKQLTLFGD